MGLSNKAHFIFIIQIIINFIYFKFIIPEKYYTDINIYHLMIFLKLQTPILVNADISIQINADYIGECLSLHFFWYHKWPKFWRAHFAVQQNEHKSLV